MRELTVRIRFTQPCLGNMKTREHEDGRYVFVRNPDGRVMFMPSWHQLNMRMASQLLGRHEGEVTKIVWDVSVDGIPRDRDQCFKRYFFAANNKRRYARHEWFAPGQVVGLNCIVPAAITNDDVRELMDLAGRYKGLSPWKPRDGFGRFEVDQIVDRRGPAKTPGGLTETTEALLKKQNV